MPSLNWKIFDSLSGSKHQNFENLCRGLMRLHFERYGQFKARANQPGVEFHIKLTKSCSLGESTHWFGWQCKWYQRNQNGDLNDASHRAIENSLDKTKEHVSGITDWILWTPYTLSKKDQDWYYALPTKMHLHLWAEEELETYLSGDGLILRSTYFGELVLTPNNLEEWHKIAIQPIRERWLPPVHQSVNVERTIRRMLGEAGSWEQLTKVGKQLRKAAESIGHGWKNIINEHRVVKEIAIVPFVKASVEFSNTLTHFHEILAQGKLEIIQQKFKEQKTLLTKDILSVPRQLRALNHPIAIDATNALADMRIAQNMLDKAENFLGVGLVAVLAEAGGGKTHMAAQLTAPQNNKPAGVFFQGRALHKGQTLDDLARTFSLNGFPIPGIDGLLAALDAAAKRACCRLPVVIDGLNEAENPKDWKPLLASLSELVKRYPNILVICTLRTGERQHKDQYWRHQTYSDNRESFAVMALPDDIQRIESKGFGENTDEAIKKYFEYFKINSGDAELPVEFLQHPLTLRIFCEVTNSKRAHEVKIDYFPASLSPLFEKYIDNAAERISQMINLSHSYSVSDINKAIYVLGVELWKSQKREISENEFRTQLSDTSRSWDSSVVNLLAQEGVIFKNPGSEPYEYIITPVYDALGGYIIANALLMKHASDFSFTWLKKPKIIAMFIGDNTHELAFDILSSLVALAPRRMSGRQIWKELAKPLRLHAIMLAADLDAEYLDKETLSAILDLLNESQNIQKRLFFRLQATRASVQYPLNANFLDSALRAMPVHKRDLSWTEWVRREGHDILPYLLTMEHRWKQKLDRRTPSDKLHAKWIMWLLTSTDHELREIATRVLYWFGRGLPEALFEETIRALEINDPYIPERMLAASYGVAMALHVDLNNQSFVNTTLPEFAQHIFEVMFAKNAPFSTTHLLIREYGTRLIEMASLHNPIFFTSEEIQRSKPPFKEGGLRDWGECYLPKEQYHSFGSPFHMNFENYTIGRLAPGRRNYDFKHQEYHKIKTQILWRIKQLGWSAKRFDEIDRFIANSHHYSRIGDNGNRIDRYGKKYSWIAFFEMYGFLCDLGKLEKDYEYFESYRFSNVDIDPSFPKNFPEAHIINTDFLGDPQIETQEWIANSPVPDVTPYLQMSQVQNQSGPWIALDGFFEQEEKYRGRSIFCFIQSFLISTKEADLFFNHLSQQNLGGRWLPEKPKVHYTFAGEIPWCDTFPANGFTEISLYNVLIPVCDFESVTNTTGYATVLAKEIASDLDLIGQPQTFDLFTRDGVKATLGLSERIDFRNSQSLFYMRKDLLKRYLEKHKLTLIWAVRGEREYSSDRFHKFSKEKKYPKETYSIYSFIKRYNYK